MTTMAMNPVRKPQTKSTPKWARIHDGIVNWWAKNHEWNRNLTPLRLTERLLRLFAVNCCKNSNFLANAENDVREALRLLECYADRKQSLFTLDANRSEMDRTRTSYWGTRGLYELRTVTLDAVDFASGPRSGLATLRCSITGSFAAIVPPARPNTRGDDVIDGRAAGLTEGVATECVRQGRLLAGIAAPDWQLVEAWRTTSTVGLAREIYDSLDFAQMPILADALQEEGCDNDEWLARMRDPGWPWCRGCHIIDSLLPELM